MLEKARLDQKDAMPKSARGEHEHYTPKEKAWVGKGAAEHGAIAAIHDFSKYSLIVCLKRVLYEHGRRSICKKNQEGNKLVKL